MKIFKKSIALSLAMAVGLSTMAQDKIIDGYFRIQSGTGEYVNVTGPVSAAPNLPYGKAVTSPGAVFYISAIQDGPYYQLKNLRSQGLDVAKDEVSAKDYIDTFFDIMNSSSDINTAIMNGGMQFGYTAIGRITVGYVLWYVGTALGSYNKSGDGYTQDDYSNLVEDFNENVLEKVDLGLRMEPIDGNGNVRLFYDVPNLQPVVEWYQATDTDEQKKRHDVFESAMKAMTKFLESRGGISLERFREADIELLKDWGYDLSEKYPTHQKEVDGETVYDFTFAEIFSDADLLFNWVKMVGYMIVKPEADKYGRIVNLREFNGLAELLQSEETGRMLVDNLHRLQPNIRVYLTNENGQFGFLEASKMSGTGENAVWNLQSKDTDSNVLTLEIEHFNTVNTSGKNYTGLYLDFPVEAMGSAEIMTLSDVQNITAGDGKTYNYTELQSLDKKVEARTPFIIQDNSAFTYLKVINDGLVFEQLPPVEEPQPEEKPENSFVISDDEVAKQHAAARRAASDGQVMYGVLIDTPAESVMNSLGLDSDKQVYALSNNNETVQANDHLAFRTANEGSTIKANQVIYSPSEPLSTGADGEPVILVGKPEVSTGVNTVATDASSEGTVIYDLNGVRVDTPQPGQIYILNGKKILVM